jgi:hypothetical protein
MDGRRIAPRFGHDSVEDAPQNLGLTLQVTLTPSPDSLVAPTLNNWAITYSCPASE